MSRCFDFGKLGKCLLAAALTAGLLATGNTQAGIFINEILLNPPDNDRNEYIEIRRNDSGTYANHYLVALENEDNNYGQVEFVLDLDNFSFTNNFKVFAPTNHQYGGRAIPPTIAGTYGTNLENSGATYLIIDTAATGTAPSVNHDWDTGTAGLSGGLYAFEGNWNAGWSVVDAIGVVGEIDDASEAVLYADINFTTGAGTTVASGAALVDTSRSALDGMGTNAHSFTEIEYVARFGNTTGTTDANVDDWIAANVTDEHDAFVLSELNWGVSGNHASDNQPEAVRGDNITRPHNYGHIISGTFNAANSTTITPEPSSLVLVFLAAVGMLLAHRRQARS